MTVRFAIPTIADGHVFLGARHQLDVYGLLNSSSSQGLYFGKRRRT
jgi:hypothetical protein